MKNHARPIFFISPFGTVLHIDYDCPMYEWMNEIRLSSFMEQPKKSLASESEPTSAARVAASPCAAQEQLE